MDIKTKQLGDFVVGENKLACLVAENLLNDTLDYCPVYFYGPTASGKTLFLHTLAKKIQMKHPEKKVIYWDSEVYVNSFIRALKNSDHHVLYSWKKQNKEADVLFFDDFEFMTKGNKKASLQTFFQMFDELCLQQKKVIIASNQRPKDIELDEGYRSRLVMGLSCEMYCPNEEVREEILRQKCEKMHVYFKPEVLRYISRNVENTGALTGALNRLLAVEADKRINLSMSQVEICLADIISKKQPVMIENIIEETSCYFGVSVEALLEKKRNHRVVMARQVAMYVVRKAMPDLTYQEIARNFQRDRSSIFYAVEKVERELEMGYDDTIEIAVQFLLSKFS